MVWGWPSVVPMEIKKHGQNGYQFQRKSEQILEMSLEEWIDRALKKG